MTSSLYKSLFLLLASLSITVPAIFALRIQASKGYITNDSGFHICNNKGNAQWWGCLPGASPPKSSICDASLSHDSTTCADSGTKNCRETRASSSTPHVMFSGNSYDCLTISGSFDEIVQVFKDGDCKQPAGSNFTAVDGTYLFDDANHCLIISPGPFGGVPGL